MLFSPPLSPQATLEREGAIAGQEVQTDVLKMELNAVETELRRARQELGACEAGRREVYQPVERRTQQQCNRWGCGCEYGI